MADLGAGAILLTSMNRDGAKTGFDLAATRAIADAINIPVIASGGVGELDHFVEGVTQGRSEEHTSELQSRPHLVCRLLLEKKKSSLCSRRSAVHRTRPAPHRSPARCCRSRPTPDGTAARRVPCRPRLPAPAGRRRL